MSTVDTQSEASHPDKLRVVLDYLPCEPCLQIPSNTPQDYFCSICSRLNRTVVEKRVVHRRVIAPVTEPEPAEEAAPEVPFADENVEIVLEPAEDESPFATRDYFAKVGVAGIDDEWRIVRPDARPEAHHEVYADEFMSVRKGGPAKAPRAGAEAPRSARTMVQPEEEEEDAFEIEGDEGLGLPAEPEEAFDVEEAVEAPAAQPEPAEEDDFGFWEPEEGKDLFEGEPEPGARAAEAAPAEAEPLVEAWEAEPVAEEVQELEVYESEPVDADEVPDVLAQTPAGPAQAGVGFEYEGYTLYRKRLQVGPSKTADMYFFSRHIPGDAEPAELSEAYGVYTDVNTGVPFVKKERLHGKPVIDVEGVGKRFAAKLEEIGIHTVDDLRGCDATMLAEHTGLSEKNLTKWVQMADIMSLPGVEEQVAEAMVDEGFTSFDAVARADAVELSDAVNRHLQAHGHERRVRIPEVEAWKAEARHAAGGWDPTDEDLSEEERL